MFGADKFSVVVLARSFTECEVVDRNKVSATCAESVSSIRASDRQSLGISELDGEREKCGGCFCERQTDRQFLRERQTDRQTESEREREGDRERESAKGDRERESKLMFYAQSAGTVISRRETETRQRDRDGHRHRQTDTGRYTDRDTQRERERERD